MFGYFRMPHKVFREEELLDGVLFTCVCVCVVYLSALYVVLQSLTWHNAQWGCFWFSTLWTGATGTGQYGKWSDSACTGKTRQLYLEATCNRPGISSQLWFPVMYIPACGSCVCVWHTWQSSGSSSVSRCELCPCFAHVKDCEQWAWRCTFRKDTFTLRGRCHRDDSVLGKISVYLFWNIDWI